MNITSNSPGISSDKIFENILKYVQKPGRYIGKEVNSIVKSKEKIDLRFAFCFPDVYEVGMSHLGIKILYCILNKRDNIWCERVFMPWFDMLKEMRKNKLPIFGIESRDPLNVFDIVGFTMQYEMSYTNILHMLNLSKIPIRASSRRNLFPLVVAGGPASCNPEPMAEFIDIFLIGEGENSILELCDLAIEAKKENKTKAWLLNRLAKLSGFYIPSKYIVEYTDEGTVKNFKAKRGASLPVKKRIIEDFNSSEYFKSFPVPNIETIHDRTTVEVLRGCIRGCRFCQAGFIYRPFRAKEPVTLNAQAREICDSSGYDEISLLSLSTSDYPKLDELLDEMLKWTENRKIKISLPSLRIDSVSESILKKISRIKRSGITFAPEAGSQSLRDSINKNLDEETIISGCRTAFLQHQERVKLYFMIGLPGETDEDVVAIADLAEKIVEEFRKTKKEHSIKRLFITLSVAFFVPKPFTPFQFAAQNTKEEFERKINLIKSNIKSRNITIDYHSSEMSYIESVLARGDRKLSRVIESVYKKGGMFESWDEGFKFTNWIESFKEHNIDPGFYSHRERDTDEINPWDLLDLGITKDFLKREYIKSKARIVTSDCLTKCSSCGIAEMTKRSCFGENKNSIQ